MSLCSSGMPLARGPWKRTTTTTSRSSSPACEGGQHLRPGRRRSRHGASTVQRSSADRAGLEDGAAEIAADQPHPAVVEEGIGERAEHVGVASMRRPRVHASVSPSSARRGRVSGEIVGAGGEHVAVEQPGIEQGARDERHAAGMVEVVHVARAVGIDARDQRHGGGQFVEVLPVDQDPRGARDRRDVDRVVGRSAGGEQADRGVDDRALVDDVAERARLGRGEVGEAVDRGAGQRLAQRRARIDEGGAW